MRQSASFQYPGWDRNNPANYAMEICSTTAPVNNEWSCGKACSTRATMLTDELTLRAGVAYHKFTQGGREVFYDDNVNGTRSKTQGTSVADITSVFTNKFGSWLIGDYDKAFAKYKEYHRFGPNTDGTGGALQDIENVYETTEETIVEYVQLDWDPDLFGKRFRGNIGLRGYKHRHPQHRLDPGRQLRLYGHDRREGRL